MTPGRENFWIRILIAFILFGFLCVGFLYVFVSSSKKLGCWTAWTALQFRRRS